MKLTGDDSPLVAGFVRSGKEAALRAELATLRKAIDDRRTVEGWATATNSDGARSVTITDFHAQEGHRCEIRLFEDVGCEDGETWFEFAGTFDEAFSAAAEWVRKQS